jgi:beta-lactamase regulating signal transducer with metallopeptidase domain
MIGGNFFVCDSCKSSILPFIQKVFSIIAVFAFGNVLISCLRTVRFKNNLHIICPQSRRIKSLEKKFSLHNKIIVFDDFRLMAFCLGVFNPKIYLSNQLLKEMTSSELKAIVLHEKQHILGKDNLLLFFLNLLTCPA